MKDRLTGLDDDARNAIIVRLPFNLTVGELNYESSYEDEGTAKEFVMNFLNDLNPGDAREREELDVILAGAVALLSTNVNVLPWGALETAIVWARG